MGEPTVLLCVPNAQPVQCESIARTRTKQNQSRRGATRPQGNSFSTTHHFIFLTYSTACYMQTQSAELVCPLCQGQTLETQPQDPRGIRLLIECNNPNCPFRELIIRESCCE